MRCAVDYCETFRAVYPRPRGVVWLASLRVGHANVASMSLRLACRTSGALGNLFRSTAVQNHEVEPVSKQCTFTSRLSATTIPEG